MKFQQIIYEEVFRKDFQKLKFYFELKTLTIKQL